MRLLSLASLVGVAFLGAVTADGVPEAAPDAPAVAPDAPAAAPAAPEAPAPADALPEGWTLFDGVQVPPPVELDPKNFDEELAKAKYTMVKLYSPYCHHCTRYAPTFQTLYEFYSTLKPPTNDPSATFADFYGLRFGLVNCVAYSDFCIKLDVRSYPTTNIYASDRTVVKNIQGVKTIEYLATEIEALLVADHPGTRPATLLLPDDKDTKRPTTPEEARAVITPAAAAAAAAGETVKDPAKEPAKELAKEPAKDKPKKPKKGVPSFPIYTGPPKLTTTPNPNGVSVNLNPETFQSLVTMTQDPWFIKFYAPWCHHCQAMAANWAQMAKAMQGKLNIGEVNCEKESRLCKDVHLNSYPTLLFFRGGERVEYNGLRGLGDFVHYAEKAVDICEGVRNVDLAAFEKLEETEEVIFLYFYDFATTSEDFMALDRLPLNLIGHAKLVKTNDTALYDRFKVTTWPRLIVSREGRPTYYSPLTPNEMRDVNQVLNWMKSVWLPIVPELTASNAREIMDGKLVVLGMLKREDDSFAGAIREMKSAANEWMDKQIQLFQLERQELRDAKQLRIEEAEDRNDQRALRAAKSIRVNMDRADKKEVSFAWVDSLFWQRWVRTTYGIDTKDGERVIINDEDNRRYWDLTSTGNPILPSRTSILETLNKVTASPPKIKPKLTISSIEKVFFDMRVTFSEHPYLTLGCFVGLSLGIASWFRGRVRWSRGHFRLEDSLGRKDFKLPILGTGLNMNGKVD